MSSRGSVIQYAEVTNHANLHRLETFSQPIYRYTFGQFQLSTAQYVPEADGFDCSLALRPQKVRFVGAGVSAKASKQQSSFLHRPFDRMIP